jgi:hypothetical protein
VQFGTFTQIVPHKEIEPMRQGVLFLSGFAAAALGSALAIAADLILADGQDLLFASALGALLGSSVGWQTLNEYGSIDADDPEVPSDPSPIR